MKRIYLITLACWVMLISASAQKLTVESMTVAGNDISASQYRKNDLTGKPCALVKVQMASSNAKFEGNVIPPTKYDAGEYWVYMTEGSKELRIKGDDFVPCHVVFSNFGVDKVKALQTYNLTLLLPQAAAKTQTQKLTINYSPADAMVLVDSKPYQGKGRIEVKLPVGNHDYQVVAMGYIANSGSVNLTASAPRTITEILTREEPAEQTAIRIETQTDSQQNAGSQKSMTFADNASAVETFTVKGVAFNMIRVDGGTYTMGATSEQGSDAGDYEKPAQQVMLSTYSIGETEVTQALWLTVMGSNPSNFKGDNLPVEMVSWEDCQKFISKLNEMTGKQFRLPTEAEWEYAARGGSKSRGYKYSGSNDLGSVAWFWKNSGDSRLDGEWDYKKMKENNCRTHPVKTKQPNELGLHDMSGNVCEWCQDWCGDYSSDAQTNPTGASSGSRRVRVFRGGGWINNARSCRSSYRNGSTPSNRYHTFGLRLAL